MPISDAEYSEWLEDDRVTRVLLVEAKYYDGTEQTEYMSTLGHITKPTDSPANQEYEDLVIAFPVFRRVMKEAFDGKTQQSFGDIEIDNTNGDRDSWLTRSWNGRDITLMLGDPTWDYADFRVIMAGSSAEITSKGIDKLSLKIRDKGIYLEKQLQEAVFSTGPNVDRIIPVCYGEVKNIEPVLEDEPTHKYKIHDGEISSIDTVYDKGVSIAFVADLPDGSFTLSAAAVGPVTADVKGAKFPGLAEGADTYWDNIADIIYDIAKNRSDLTASDIDTTNFSDFKTAHPQKVGVWIRDKDKFTQVLDTLVTSVGGFWGFSRDGKLGLGQLLDPAAETSTLTITADDIVINGMTVKRRQLPRYRVTLGHTRYWRPQGPSEVAGVAEDLTADLGQEYRLSISEDLTVKTTHLLAHESGVLPTVLVDSTEADTEALRRKDLRDGLRTVYTVDAFATPFSVELGDVITVDHDRFGFDGGTKAVVVGYSETVTPPRIKLDLWN